MIKKMLVFVFIIGIAVAAFFVFKITRNFDLQNQNSAAVIEAKTEKLSILAFGDMMLDRMVYAKTQKAGDFNYPFLNIDEFLKTADLKFANLEGPITDYKSVSNGNSRMRFTISPDFLPVLQSRFDVLSLANNHVLDFGEEGYNQAKNYLSGAGINYFGDYNNRPENLSTIVEKNGIKVGFIGYHGLVDGGFEDVLKEIPKIKIQSDFVIIVPHWGAEYKTVPAESTQEKARMFIDAGADLVLGGHPHVAQSTEEYNGKMIFYSLGNFIFDQYFSQETMESKAVEIILEKSDNRVKASYKQHKILINENSQPRLAE